MKRLSTHHLTAAGALALLTMAAWNSPQPAWADSYQTGVQLYSQKKYPQAIQAFKSAAAENPRNPNPYYYAGLCHHALGNKPMAKKSFQFLIDNFPNSPAANNARQALASVDSTPSVQGQFGGPATASASEPEEETISATKGLEGHMVVRAEVNGKPIEMMFDTGASACVFGKNHMQQLGISMDGAQPGPPIHGSSGDMKSWQLQADVRLGRIKRRIPIFIQEKMLTDPLMGQMFYQGYQCAVDNTNGTIKFIKQGRAVTSMSSNTIDVPFKKMGTTMIVRGRINGRDQDMIFDTGASEVILTPAQLKQLGLQLPADATISSGSGSTGLTQSTRMTVDRIEIGPILKTNFTVKVLPSGPPLPLVGQSFHGDRRFVIDAEKCVIKFPR